MARRREGWSGDGMFLEWDGRSQGPWALALEGATAVINLAGRSVNCRYHPANRREILESRVEATRAVGEAVARCHCPPRVWLNASTAAWYRPAEDGPQDEWRGDPGEGFACDVARSWEDAFFGMATPPATRKVALRIGMVLANEPGTVFDVLRRLTTWGLGGAAGSGRQRVSWIHMEDLLRAVALLIDDPFLEGPFNVTAPEHPDNRGWMRAFREMVGMPVGLPATRGMIDLGARLLQTEPELVLKSRWVAPVRLHDAGFQWRWPTAVDALMDLRERPGLAGFFRAATPRSKGARGWLPDPASRRA